MGKAMTMLCFLLPFIFQICLTASAEVKHYDWDVEYMYWKPDCVEHLVMGINGKFPGPTIRAKAGDTVQVNLTNKLGTEGLVIHWHGIRQINTPWFDGTASISQCAIDVGESFVYNFTVDRAGTYFYHGHFGMQRSAGLYGSIVVDVADGEKEPFVYDGEINLLLSDWWHESVHEQEVGLSSKPFRWIGEPQSILINGKGQYNCSLGAKFLNDSATSCSDTEMSPQCQPDIHSVDQNKTYRVRIASTTSLASISFAIGNHNMTLVEADGNYVQPVSVDSLNIYSGDTYSVLITTNQDPSTNYWISAYQIARKPPLPPPGLTILNYKPNPVSDAPLSPPPTSPEWNDFAGGKSFANKILALKSDQHPIPKPPTKFDRRIVLLNTQNRINGYIKWAINNVSLVLPTTPLIGSLKFGLKNAFDGKSPAEDFPATYDIMKPPVNPNSTYGNNLYSFDYNITIDVIIQNANVLSANVSEVHPWHLHGHDFWVLGYGDGKFSEENDGKDLNLDNPPLRNTVVIFPHGWTAIRFVTDNPGVWPFHCHIEPHLHMGMGVVFAEAVDKIKTIPDGVLTCGLTTKNGGLVGGSSSGPPGAAVSTHYLLFIYLFYVIYIHSFE